MEPTKKFYIIRLLNGIPDGVYHVYEAQGFSEVEEMRAEWHAFNEANEMNKTAALHVKYLVIGRG